MKNFLYSLFIGLFGIVALTSIAFLLMYAAQSKQQAHLYSDLAAVRKQDTQQEIASQSSVQPTSRNLYLENSDMVGWVQIEGTSIDYPVMQTPADPNYYLKHDFEKNYTDLISYFSISPLLSLFFVAGFGVLPPFYPHFRGLPLFLTISCLKKTHGVLH